MTVRHNLKILPGNPYPMGVSETGDGNINFAAALHTRQECGVLLYLNQRTAPIRLPFAAENRVGNIDCLQVEGLADTGFQYNFYAGDEIITDPYAGTVYGNGHWGRKASPSLKGGYQPQAYDWEDDRPLMTPLSETILYLVHPRGFTRHPSSGVEHKGTFTGLMEKIPYLQSLGVTAVELMPAYEFLELEKPALGHPTMEQAKAHYMDEPPAEGEPKINYWGYKLGYYFAPKMSYCATDCPATEFRDLVKKLHRAGIELIMQFYFPVEVKQAYILEAVRHWVLDYHVDGFHLMGLRVPMALLATDPMLGNTKLFYQEIPCSEIYTEHEIPVYRNLAVYNDEFMYTMRHFLKSDEGALQPALGCLKRNPKQNGVINYITNYYGFTLADLVSYDRKHNEENGEENRDGEVYNVSWNCGCEGKTRKKGILELRLRQMKNAVLLLLTSQGTPMIVSGDEFGFERGGNNNPYCQDNGINWLNWGLEKKNGGFLDFIREMIALRKEHPVLHKPEECTMLDYIACGYPDLSYHGEEAWRLNTDSLSRLAGVMYCGKYAKKNRQEDDSYFYIAYNMHWEDHEFALPALPSGMSWDVVCDTGGKPDGTGLQTGQKTRVKGRSIRILEGRNLSGAERKEQEKEKRKRTVPETEAGQKTGTKQKADINQKAGTKQKAGQK